MTESNSSTLPSTPDDRLPEPIDHGPQAGAGFRPPPSAAATGDPAAECWWLNRACRRPLADLARFRPSGDPAADRVLRYLEQHVFDRDFKIDRALLDCRIRGNDFSSSFKKRLGTGLKELVTATRIACAAALLADSPLPVRDIARLVGYGSPQGFQRAFRRQHGVSPRQARLNQSRNPGRIDDGSKLSLAARRFPGVARRLAQSLWDEVEAMDTLEQASRLLECLDWQGDELFLVAEQRMLVRRRQDPHLALRGNQLLLRLAEVQRQPQHWARARLQLGLTQYLIGGPEYLQAALTEIEKVQVRDPWIGLLRAQVSRLLQRRHRPSSGGA